MKVTKTQTPPAFKPIELQITIESAKELQVLQKTLQANHTNAQAMVIEGTLNIDDARLLADMFAELYRAL